MEPSQFGLTQFSEPCRLCLVNYTDLISVQEQVSPIAFYLPTRNNQRVAPSSITTSTLDIRLVQIHSNILSIQSWMARLWWSSARRSWASLRWNKRWRRCMCRNVPFPRRSVRIKKEEERRTFSCTRPVGFTEGKKNLVKKWAVQEESSLCPFVPSD